MNKIKRGTKIDIMNNETYTVLPSLYFDEVKHVPYFAQEKVRNMVKTHKKQVFNLLCFEIFSFIKLEKSQRENF